MPHTLRGTDSRPKVAMADSPTPIIRCGERVRAHTDAHDRAGRLASAQLAAGVGRGDRVAVLARNDIEFLEVSLAIASAGANPVPINTRWRAGEIAHVLADCAPRVIFALGSSTHRSCRKAPRVSCCAR